MKIVPCLILKKQCTRRYQKPQKTILYSLLQDLRRIIRSSAVRRNLERHSVRYAKAFELPGHLTKKTPVPSSSQNHWLHKKDPIGVAGGDINFYRYVNNQPLVGADPHGLKIYYMWSGLHVDVRIEGKDTHRYDGQWGFAPDASSVSEELWQMFLGGFTWVPGMISYNSGGFRSLAINSDSSDARVYQNIMSSMSNPPMYNIIYYDCWDWASSG